MQVCWRYSTLPYFSLQYTYLISAGIRVSLYNAVTEEQTDKLVAYIREFVEKEAAAAGIGPRPAPLEVEEQ